MKKIGNFLQNGKQKELFTKKMDMDENLKIYKSYSDSIFGQVSIMQNIVSKDYYLSREKIFESWDTTKRNIEITQKIEKLDHPYLLSLIDHSIEVERSLCAKRYVIKQIYKFPRNDLRREIDLRAAKGLLFSVFEMVHILYQIIEVNAYLQWKGIIHGNLCPEALGIETEPEILLQLKLSPDQGYSRMALREERLRDYLAKKFLYVSPAIFRCIIKNKEFHGDFCTEDVFSAGLILLEAGNGKPLMQIYRADGEIDEEALKRLLQEFKNRYASDSTLLVSVLENMLQRDENRPTFQDLKDNMPLYDEVKSFLRENQFK